MLIMSKAWFKNKTPAEPNFSSDYEKMVYRGLNNNWHNALLLFNIDIYNISKSFFYCSCTWIYKHKTLSFSLKISSYHFLDRMKWKFGWDPFMVAFCERYCVVLLKSTRNKETAVKGNCRRQLCNAQLTWQSTEPVLRLLLKTVSSGNQNWDITHYITLQSASTTYQLYINALFTSLSWVTFKKSCEYNLTSCIESAWWCSVNGKFISTIKHKFLIYPYRSAIKSKGLEYWPIS